MARKILLADDSVTAQNMGRKILTDAGYDVVAVNNGSAALKKIVEQKPDLIVLDVYMPGYSGLEVCQRIKENRETARIPVLLTVGKLEPFKPEEARRARADAFVVKPFEASELLSALAKLEEKIAPQPEPYKPGRFAKAIASLDEPESGVGTEKFDDSDSGWKSRLRFPGRKKQAEPEPAPEIVAPVKSVRDFRDEPLPAPPAPAKTSPVHEFERPLPTGIPRDITPEEIAAITAAAARLNGVSAAPSTSEPAPPPPPPLDAARLPEPTAASAPAEAQPVTASAPDFDPSPAALPAMADLAPITFASAPVQVEEKFPEEKSAEVQTVATSVDVPTIPEAAPPVPVAEQIPAPEPSTAAASTADAVPAVAGTPAAADIPSLPVVESPAIAQVVSEPPALPVVAVEGLSQAQSETQPPVAQVQNEGEISPAVASSEPAPSESRADSLAAHAVEEVAAPLPAIEPAASAHAPAAQDEEVMAALQNLIPLNGDSASQNSPNLLATVADFGNGGPSPRPRWIFEEAIVTADEAALSLEQEMEKAYSSFAASEAGRLLAASALESLVPAQSSAVAAAVVTPVTPAEPEFANFESESAKVEAISDPPAFASASSQPAEASTVHAMASAACAGEGSISVPSTAASEELVSAITEPQVVQAEPAVAEPAAAEPAAETPAQPAEPSRPVVTDFQVAAASESIQEAGLADARSQAQASAEGAVPSPDASFETISAGDDDTMGKNSDFKMIRQSPAGTKAAASAAPVTKENFDPAAVKAEPAAMAAAASAEAAPAVPPMPASAPDPRAIASIVDSVLAELRPKIVEEIAKKLSEPNK